MISSPEAWNKTFEVRTLYMSWSSTIQTLDLSKIGSKAEVNAILCEVDFFTKHFYSFSNMSDSVHSILVQFDSAEML